MILATLDRFGYELTTIAETKEAAIKAMMKEYTRVYKQINGTTPRKDMYDEGVSFYAQAKEDINIHEIEIGKVGWL